MRFTWNNGLCPSQRLDAVRISIGGSVATTRKAVSSLLEPAYGSLRQVAAWYGGQMEMARQLLIWIRRHAHAL